MADTGATPAGTASTTPATTDGNKSTGNPNGRQVVTVEEAAKKASERGRKQLSELQKGINEATAIAKDLAAIAKDPAGAAVAAAKGPISDAIKKSPLYQELKGVFGAFDLASLKNLFSVAGIVALAKAYAKTLPPIRFPVSNATKEKIIGYGKKLKEVEAQLKAFAVNDIGLPADLTSGKFKQMMNDINGIMASAKDAADAAQKLAAAGYRVTPDGPGFIFEDAQGNKIVDFSNGLGDIGATLSAISDVNQSYEDVKDKILVPLSDNQATAIASLVNHIGAENFLNSNVLAALNEGKYSEIPRLMQGWVMGAPPGGYGEPVPRQDYADRRLFEGELFQTPDEVDVSPPDDAQPGELTYAQLAAIIEIKRTSYIEQKKREFGFS